MPYITGTIENFMNRLHQIGTGFADILSYVAESSDYVYNSGNAVPSGLSGVWERELRLKYYFVSGSGVAFATQMIRPFITNSSGSGIYVPAYLFDLWLNMENGNQGDAITTTGQMNQSITGNTGVGFWKFQNPTFSGFFVSTGNSISGNASNTGAVYNFYKAINVNGQTISDQGTRGWVYDHQLNSPGLGLQYKFNATLPNNVSVGAFINFRLSGVAAGGTYDHIVLADAAGKSCSVNQKIAVGGVDFIQLEDTNFAPGSGTNGFGGSGISGFVNVTGTQTYWVTMCWNRSGTSLINVYTPNVTGFTMLGTLSGGCTTNACDHFIIGQNGHNGVAGKTYWDNFVVNMSGVFPLMPQ